ncbi:MAG: hypothetical protein CME69_09250 [Halobacteriovorax sp.]|nr:hypothetical protein [Halobacteriovorax sp.]|tara:strand:+ start:456 stop:998 length:543 start_codon:yes stop_codon:yes gene_type:complete
MKLILAVLMMFSITTIHAAEFEDGDYFTAHIIRGSVTAVCRDRGYTRNVHYTCSGSYLEPGNFSKLIITNDVDADRVEFNYTTSRGKARRKIARIKDGVSRPVNLWINTLTQRPLLKRGENEINYTLTKNKEVVDQGTMHITVDSAPLRTCMHGYIRTFSDCAMVGNICGEYFRRYNNCQ